MVQNDNNNAINNSNNENDQQQENDKNENPKTDTPLTLENLKQIIAEILQEHAKKKTHDESSVISDSSESFATSLKNH